MRQLTFTFLSLTLLGLATAHPAAGQKFDFAKEFPYRGLLSWTPGMRFRMQAADAGFDCPLMALRGATFRGTDLYGGSPDDRALAGQVFTFVRLDAFRDRGYDDQNTGSGTDQTAVVFRTATGKQYAHVIRTPLAELKPADNPVGAPCLVWLDEVDKARQVLVGRTVYVLEQYVAAGSTRDDVRYLPKLVPVKITGVAVGSGSRPVQLTFAYVGSGEVQQRNYLLSGTNSSRTYGDGELLPDSFLKCFSLSDPRATLGEGIVDARWQAIQKGSVIKGMTMKEVALAMGKPRRKAESLGTERLTAWYYSRFQGKEWELLFRNGLLDSYVTSEE